MSNVDFLETFVAHGKTARLYRIIKNVISPCSRNRPSLITGALLLTETARLY